MPEIKTGQVWKRKDSEARAIVVAVNLEQSMVWVEQSPQTDDGCWTMEYLVEYFELEAGWNSIV